MAIISLDKTEIEKNYKFCVPLPALKNRFRIRVAKSSDLEAIEVLTMQAISLDFKGSPTNSFGFIANAGKLTIDFEVDWKGEVISKLKEHEEHSLIIELSVLDGDDTIYYVIQYKDVRLKKYTFSHDYAASETVKVKALFSVRDFDMVPSEIFKDVKYYERGLFVDVPVVSEEPAVTEENN